MLHGNLVSDRGREPTWSASEWIVPGNLTGGTKLMKQSPSDTRAIKGDPEKPRIYLYKIVLFFYV